MKFTVKSEKPGTVKAGCVVLGVFEKRWLSDAAGEFDKTTRGLLTRLLKDGEMDGKCGQTLLVHYPRGAHCERVLLVGCGKQKAFTEKRYRDAVAAAAAVVNSSGASDATSYLAELDVSDRDLYWKVRQMVEVSIATLYSPDELKSKKGRKTRQLRRLAVNAADADTAHRAINDGGAIANGVELARRLGNLPGIQSDCASSNCSITGER